MRFIQMWREMRAAHRKIRELRRRAAAAMERMGSKPQHLWSVDLAVMLAGVHILEVTAAMGPVALVQIQPPMDLGVATGQEGVKAGETVH